MVMGGDSCPGGRVFKSQHRILDDHFSPNFFVKIEMCIRKDENKLKRISLQAFVHLIIKMMMTKESEK